MQQQYEQTVEELEGELQSIGEAIEMAALREDVVEHSRLLMRRDALPGELRAARARPLRREIAQLQLADENLADEQAEIQESETELSEEEVNRGITAAMKKNQMLSGVAERRSSVDRKLKKARRQLEDIEQQGPIPLE